MTWPAREGIGFPEAGRCLAHSDGAVRFMITPSQLLVSHSAPFCWPHCRCPGDLFTGQAAG